MLNLLVMSYVLAAQQATPPLTAVGLVSKMFARYAAAKTLSGTLKTTQTAGAASVVTETSLAYERPSKLRLDQTQTSASKRRTKMIVSDGKNVAYTLPERLIATTPFFVEPLKSNAGVDRTIADLYPLIASDLPDRSPVLDALIARTDDLRYFKNQLGTLKITGRTTAGGQAVVVIEGAWRETDLRNAGDADRHIGDPRFVGDSYKLYITDAGDLVRYELLQHFAAPAAGAGPGRPRTVGEPILVTTVWEASIVVDGPIKPGAFALKTR